MSKATTTGKGGRLGRCTQCGGPMAFGTTCLSCRSGAWRDLGDKPATTLANTKPRGR